MRVRPGRGLPDGHQGIPTVCDKGGSQTTETAWLEGITVEAADLKNHFVSGESTHPWPSQWEPIFMNGAARPENTHDSAPLLHRLQHKHILHKKESISRDTFCRTFCSASGAEFDCSARYVQIIAYNYMRSFSSTISYWLKLDKNKLFKIIHKLLSES